MKIKLKGEVGRHSHLSAREPALGAIAPVTPCTAGDRGRSWLLSVMLVCGRRRARWARKRVERAAPLRSERKVLAKCLERKVLEHLIGHRTFECG